MASPRVAYLINQYPKVSHSFIRTEIQAVEAHGIEVVRLALRGWDAELVDAADHEEQAKTQYILRGGASGLLAAMVATLFTAPGRLMKSLALAVRLSRRAERPLPYHHIYWLEACVAARLVRRAGATHIHAHFGSNGAEVAMLAALIGGFTYSVTMHGSEEFDKPYVWKLREKIHGAAFIAAVSSYCRSQLWRHVEAEDWAKIAIVHCGIDESFLGAPTTPVPTANHLVCVGRLCEQKAQLLLIAATAKVVARGIDVFLTLAGDGDMRGDVEAAIARHRLGDRVTITGWVTGDEIRALLADSKALVLPSFAEGLPVVIMEAMAMARPVLSTRITGIPELVRDGIDGILVTAGDEDELADAMERLLTADQATLDAMGASGKARVGERHAASTEAAKLATLFAGLPA